jgi:DNA-directed RNA polymerase specialized sigma24 family protein
MAISIFSGKKNPQYSDEELIEMLKSGGLPMEKALYWMFEQYRPLADIAIRTKSMDEADALEMYEETLMTVRDHVSADVFKRGSSLKTYFNRIFSNKCIDKIRRNSTNTSRTEKAIAGFMEVMGITEEDKPEEFNLNAATAANQLDLIRILCLDLARAKLSQVEQDLLVDAIVNEIKNKDLVEKYAYKNNKVVASTIYGLKDKLKKAILEICKNDPRCALLCKPGG